MSNVCVISPVIIRADRITALDCPATLVLVTKTNGLEVHILHTKTPRLELVSEFPVAAGIEAVDLVAFDAPVKQEDGPTGPQLPDTIFCITREHIVHTLRFDSCTQCLVAVAPARPVRLLDLLEPNSQLVTCGSATVPAAILAHSTDTRGLIMASVPIAHANMASYGDSLLFAREISRPVTQACFLTTQAWACLVAYHAVVTTNVGELGLICLANGQQEPPFVTKLPLPLDMRLPILFLVPLRHLAEHMLIVTLDEICLVSASDVMNGMLAFPRRGVEFFGVPAACSPEPLWDVELAREVIYIGTDKGQLVRVACSDGSIELTSVSGRSGLSSVVGSALALLGTHDDGFDILLVAGDAGYDHGIYACANAHAILCQSIMNWAPVFDWTMVDVPELLLLSQRPDVHVISTAGRGAGKGRLVQVSRGVAATNVQIGDLSESATNSWSFERADGSVIIVMTSPWRSQVFAQSVSGELEQLDDLIEGVWAGVSDVSLTPSGETMCIVDRDSLCLVALSSSTKTVVSRIRDALYAFAGDYVVAVSERATIDVLEIVPSLDLHERVHIELGQEMGRIKAPIAVNASLVDSSPVLEVVIVLDTFQVICAQINVGGSNGHFTVSQPIMLDEFASNSSGKDVTVLLEHRSQTQNNVYVFRNDGLAAVLTLDENGELELLRQHRLINGVCEVLPASHDFAAAPHCYAMLNGALFRVALDTMACCMVSVVASESPEYTSPSIIKAASVARRSRGAAARMSETLVCIRGNQLIIADLALREHTTARELAYSGGLLATRLTYNPASNTLALLHASSEAWLTVIHNHTSYRLSAASEFTPCVPTSMCLIPHSDIHTLWIGLAGSSQTSADSRTHYHRGHHLYLVCVTLPSAAGATAADDSDKKAVEDSVSVRLLADLPQSVHYMTTLPHLGMLVASGTQAFIYATATLLSRDSVVDVPADMNLSFLSPVVCARYANQKDARPDGILDVYSQRTGVYSFRMSTDSSAGTMTLVSLEEHSMMRMAVENVITGYAFRKDASAQGHIVSTMAQSILQLDSDGIIKRALRQASVTTRFAGAKPYACTIDGSIYDDSELWKDTLS